MRDSLIAKTIYQKQTERLGEIFAKQLIGLIGKAPLVIAIKGDAKSGKTTFIRGLAKGFGVAKEEISFSGFGFINKYQGENMTFYHIDPYRLENPDVIAQELRSVFKQQGSVIVVEQANKLREFLPDDAIWLDIVDLHGTERAIILYPRANTPIPEAFKTLQRLGALK